MSKFYNTHFSQTTHNPTNYTALTCKGLIGFPTRCCMKYPVTQGTQNTVTIAKEIPVHYSFFPLWLSAWLFKASTRGNKDLASSSPNQYTNSLESHTLKKKISSVYVEEKKVCSLWNKCGPLYGSQMPNALQFCDRIVSCKAVKVVIGTINVRLIQVH